MTKENEVRIVVRTLISGFLDGIISCDFLSSDFHERIQDSLNDDSIEIRSSGKVGEVDKELFNNFVDNITDTVMKEILIESV